MAKFAGAVQINKKMAFPNRNDEDDILDISGIGGAFDLHDRLPQQ
jgi:hypothetical protein